MQVLVAGAGRMGAQIAIEYALGGHEVTLLARNPVPASDRVDAGWALAIDAGLASPEEVVAARLRLQTLADLGNLERADLVVESIVEDLPAKIALLTPLAARFPAATIASNTSSLSITEIGVGIGARERMLGTHYWNPPLLMPLVELIAPDGVDSHRADAVEGALRRMGKRPVRVQRDVPGFVWNRLQLALVREAAWIVEQGVATPEAVDEIVRDGLARRWTLTGPFETMALGGAETFTRIAANLFPVLSHAETLERVDRWLPTETGQLSELRARRDRGLMRALAEDQRRGDGQ